MFPIIRTATYRALPIIAVYHGSSLRTYRLSRRARYVELRLGMQPNLQRDMDTRQMLERQDKKVDHLLKLVRILGLRD